MKPLPALFLCLALPGSALAATYDEVRVWFEAGKNQQVIDAAKTDPKVLFLAGHAYLKLDKKSEAKATFAKLTADDAWKAVGAAAIALVDGKNDEALDKAKKATSANGGLLEAQYQLGLVQRKRGANAEAAAAFDKAGSLNTFAYAHYNAGLAYYDLKKYDKMSDSFQRFLKLAPNAPEKGKVESIMKTLGGGR